MGISNFDKFARVTIYQIHVHEYGFVLFPTSFLENTMMPAHWGMVLYGSLFCQSLVLLAFHFVYRYLLICKNHFLYLFNSAKYIPLWFSLWLLMGIIWGTVLHIYMYHSKMLTDYFRETLWETYGYDVNKSAILGPVYRHPNELGVLVWDWGQLFSLAVCMGELGSTFMVIMFCTWNIHQTLKTTAMSEASKRLEQQLFKALLVQTTIPLILEYTPGGIDFLCPLFHIPIGRGTNLSPILISFYPVLDPICMLYFIKDYRYALLRKLRFNTNATVSMASGASDISQKAQIYLQKPEGFKIERERESNQ
ncbi:unnamed protein product, partial [Mesorhabditis belari]|uniref:Seven TM Receptor n=1 Tax=Mesorhabditis belari TaxID=2138241 RepID=A0AAF3F693_9BILA